MAGRGKGGPSGKNTMQKRPKGVSSRSSKLMNAAAAVNENAVPESPLRTGAENPTWFDGLFNNATAKDNKRKQASLLTVKRKLDLDTSSDGSLRDGTPNKVLRATQATASPQHSAASLNGASDCLEASKGASESSACDQTSASNKNGSEPTVSGLSSTPKDRNDSAAAQTSTPNKCRNDHQSRRTSFPSGWVVSPSAAPPSGDGSLRDGTPNKVLRATQATASPQHSAASLNGAADCLEASKGASESSACDQTSASNKNGSESTVSGLSSTPKDRNDSAAAQTSTPNKCRNDHQSRRTSFPSGWVVSPSAAPPSGDGSLRDGTPNKVLRATQATASPQHSAASLNGDGQTGVLNKGTSSEPRMGTAFTSSWVISLPGSPHSGGGSLVQKASHKEVTQIPKESPQPSVFSLMPSGELVPVEEADSVIALALRNSDSASANPEVVDRLIEAALEYEEIEAQRVVSSPDLFEEMDLNHSETEQDENDNDQENITDVNHSSDLGRALDNERMESMQTPISRPKKRISIPKPSKRKRIRDPSKWMDHVRKEARNAGTEYTSKRGKKVDSVSMGNPCACSKYCFRKISEEDRKKAFSTYYSTKTQQEKWDFITRHSECSTVAKRTTNNEATSRRNSTRKYFFYTAEEEKVYVCKVMFVNTLAISHGVIDSAYKHLLTGNTKMVSPDKRGKHNNRPLKTSDAQKETIRRHINLYPRVPSHYTRARSQREYLEWGLSIARMSKQYLEWCATNNIHKDAIASRRKYHTLFCTEFNISFFKPKKDQCGLCRLIKTGTREEREQYKEKYIKHLKNKKLARKELKAAKEAGVKDHSIKVCAFDLQKVLPLPKSEVSTFFYMSKLSLYNLSCFDLIKKSGICNLWHEGIAKRGSNEISSCLMLYVEKAALQGCKTILSFSDSCGGQNKNRFFFCMMLLAAAKYKVTFQHTFLEPGHTQNENDSIHARIESEAKLKEIFDMDEWIALIESAKQEDPMYEVEVLKRSQIYDFHFLVDHCQQWERDTQKQKIGWSKVKVLRADPNQVGMLYFKYTYDGEERVLNTKKAVVGRPLNLSTYKLSPAYAGKLPIPQMKREHLTKLCKTLAIPSKYHAFYAKVMDETEENDQEEIAENEEDSSDDEAYEPPQRAHEEFSDEDGEFRDEDEEEQD